MEAEPSEDNQIECLRQVDEEHDSIGFEIVEKFGRRTTGKRRTESEPSNSAGGRLSQVTSVFCQPSPAIRSSEAEKDRPPPTSSLSEDLRNTLNKSLSPQMVRKEHFCTEMPRQDSVFD